MALSENLKSARAAANLTLKEVAEQLGTGFAAVQKWENGIRVPNGVRLVQLAKIYHTTAEDLVLGKKEKKDERNSDL